MRRTIYLNYKEKEDVEDTFEAGNKIYKEKEDVEDTFEADC